MPSKRYENAAIGLTFTRYGLAELTARRLRDKKPFALPLATFILTDIADGIVFRKMGIDTPKRRMADAFVDRVSVFRVCTELYRQNQDSRPHLLGLLASESIITASSIYHYFNTGEVLQGHGPHKLRGLSVALYGFLATKENLQASAITGLGVNTTNAVLSLDYLVNALNPSEPTGNKVRKISF